MPTKKKSTDVKLKNLHDNHRERMRARYVATGLEGFHDHELLELLLYYCYPRCDTNPIAHKILNEFKSLAGVFEASVKSITLRTNCSERVAILLSMMSGVATRYMKSYAESRPVLGTPSDAGEHAMKLFVAERREILYMICLNAHFKVNAIVKLATGTVDAVHVFKREIMADALNHNALDVILVHNHPSGEIIPSEIDNHITAEVAKLMEPVGIRLVDHIIVGINKYYSYAARFDEGEQGNLSKQALKKAVVQAMQANVLVAGYSKRTD